MMTIPPEDPDSEDFTKGVDDVEIDVLVEISEDAKSNHIMIEQASN